MCNNYIVRLQLSLESEDTYTSATTDFWKFSYPTSIKVAHPLRFLSLRRLSHRVVGRVLASISTTINSTRQLLKDNCYSRQLKTTQELKMTQTSEKHNKHVRQYWDCPDQIGMVGNYVIVPMPFPVVCCV